MKHSFARGFKSDCERLAHEVRSELDLSDIAAFDPRGLAEHLAIPVSTLSDLANAGADVSSVQHFLRAGKADFSAMTIFRGSQRLIIENDAHSDGRRSNSLSHELSHVLLEHDAAPALDGTGCRHWSEKHEQEADWLAGVLLIPREAALHVLRSAMSPEVARRTYEVSAKLLAWRLNHSGAKKQFARERAKWARK